MAFIKNGNTIISFAEYQDVLDMDQRLFEANEGLTEDVVEYSLVRSTLRILTLIRDTDWWRDYYLRTASNPSYLSKADLPQVDPSKIIGRLDDFQDLCVYHTFWDHLLPRIADFSKEDNAERAKIGFYQGKFQFLFDELINGGDWYDLNGDGTITQLEKFPGNYAQKRVR